MWEVARMHAGRASGLLHGLVTWRIGQYTISDAAVLISCCACLLPGVCR